MMIRCLTTLLFLVWSTGPGVATDPGIIKGIVFDKSGKPVENVTITIASMEFTSLNLTVKTDRNGQFIEVSVQAGYYQIKARKEGYITQIVEMRIWSQQTLEVSFALEEGLQNATESSGEEQFKIGNEYFSKELYDEAAKSYREAIVKEPNEPLYYNNLGIAYLQLEQLDEALDAYHRMIEIQPRSYSAHRMIGELHSLKKQYRQALPYLTRAVELSPDDPDAFYNLGVCLMNAGASSQSLEALKRVIELEPEYSMAYYQVGMIYVNQHRKKEAINNLEKFLVLSPDNPNADVAKKIIEYLKTTR